MTLIATSSLTVFSLAVYALATYLAIVVLFSFIERPFVTWSGVQKHGLATSLLANVVASIIVILFLLLAESTAWSKLFRRFDISPKAALLAFAMYVALKFLVIRLIARKRIVATSIVCGSFFSLAASWIMLHLLLSIDESYPRLWRSLVPYSPWCLCISYALFAGIAFALTMSVTKSRFIKRESDSSPEETA